MPRAPFLLAGLLLLSAAVPAAGQIDTGGETGAYHATFCPPLEATLKKNQLDYRCTASEGSRENIERVAGNAAEVGFAQLDVFAEDTAGRGELFTTIRSDIARECLFLVARNRQFTNLGEVASVAGQLRFILPPQRSGSAGTFAILQKLDPQGLGLARNITHVGTADEAIAQALSAEDTVTLLVQFPDPANARFKAIAAQGGNIIPVIDRSILRQERDGQKIYFAEETEITLPKWNKSAEKVVTACTPMLLFTGAPERLTGSAERQDHEDLIRTIRALAVEELRPKESFLASLWRKTKALSAKSVEKMIELTEKARKEAQPMMQDALDKAKEMTEEARKQAEKMLEDAKKAAEEAGEGSTGSGSGTGSGSP